MYKSVCSRVALGLRLGILFAPHTGHQRGEHLCIDYFAEGGGSGDNENGHLLYPVELSGVQGYTNFATAYVQRAARA